MKILKCTPISYICMRLRTPVTEFELKDVDDERIRPSHPGRTVRMISERIAGVGVNKYTVDIFRIIRR